MTLQASGTDVAKRQSGDAGFGEAVTRLGQIATAGVFSMKAALDLADAD
jgi:hypothetical protein